MSFRPLRRLAFAASTVIALAYAGCGTGNNSGGGDGGGGSGGASASGGKDGSSGSGGVNLGGSGGVNLGGSGGGSGGSAGDACASTVVQSDLVRANLLFVIDRSGSMNCNLPSDGQTTAECEAKPAPENPALPTKWKLTNAALKQAITDLMASNNVSAGMVAFPTPNTDCGVTQAPDVPIKNLDGPQNTALATFLDSVIPKGKTPLAGATILAYAYLYEQLKAGSLPGNLFVVLLTDGFETCKVEEIPKLLGTDVPTAYNSLGIRTFVIGVPGSEDGRALLSQIAFLGGTPKTASCIHNPTPNDVGDCHFDMTTGSNFANDLKAALAAISGTVLSCELDMPSAPAGKQINYATVTVTNSAATPTEVPKDDSKPCGSGANGWQFSADKTKIFLCGTACDDAKKPGVSLSINLGCLIDIR